MTKEDLERFKKYLERQTLWKIWLIRIFMETHMLFSRLAKWIRKEFRSKHEQQ